MYQAGLVLEGGAMKGIYTAGVLDFFLDHQIVFSNVYGVSAGAVNMCSYLSKQRGRARDVTIDYLECKSYCSFRNLLTTGDLFQVQMCYQLIPDYLNPFDHDAFAEYRGRAFSVATDIETGRPEYFQLRDMRKDIDKVRASASMPLVSKNVKINGRLYLDGGISDSIPLLKAVTDGNRKNVVVMTKEPGYVRKPSSQMGLLKLRYLAYPRVYQLMAERHMHYCQQVAYVERMQKEGKVFVLRPRKDWGVGRIEKDAEKLMKLYRQGYEDAEAQQKALQDFLRDVPEQ